MKNYKIGDKVYIVRGHLDDELRSTLMPGTICRINKFLWVKAIEVLFVENGKEKIETFDPGLLYLQKDIESLRRV